MNGMRPEKGKKKPRQALDSEKSKGFNKSLTSQSMHTTIKNQLWTSYGLKWPLMTSIDLRWPLMTLNDL